MKSAILIVGKPTEPSFEYFGYVYLWYDTKRNKFCLGSHHGKLTDNYLTSTGHCLRAIKKRPETFRFKVLEYNCVTNDKRITLQKEQNWLNRIKVEELGTKYYNLKRFAAGGNTIEGYSLEQLTAFKKKCSIASQRQWDKNSPTYDKRMQKAKELVTIMNSNFTREKRIASYTSERKKKQSSIMKGENNPFYGKHHTRESSEKMSKSRIGNKNRAKIHEVITCDGVTHGPFLGGAELEKYFNLNESNIKLKWFKFINTNKSVTSIRKNAELHPLYGAIINAK